MPEANVESGKRVQRRKCTGYTDACQTDLRATNREGSLGCTDTNSRLVVTFPSCARAATSR